MQMEIIILTFFESIVGIGKDSFRCIKCDYPNNMSLIYIKPKLDRFKCIILDDMSIFTQV